MFTSLDYMHHRWQNCPIAWQGSFTNKDRSKLIILKAIADQSCGFGIHALNCLEVTTI
jgi:hypothetical protein